MNSEFLGCFHFRLEEVLFVGYGSRNGVVSEDMLKSQVGSIQVLQDHLNKSKLIIKGIMKEWTEILPCFVSLESY